MTVSEINGKLSEWGLSSIKKPKPVEYILNMDYRKIDSLDLKKIDRILVILGQYQIYLQTQLNLWAMRKRRFKEMYEREINRIAKDMDGKTLAAKKAKALEKNDKLKSLLEKYDEAASCVDLLYKIPDAVADLTINFRKIRDSKESELKVSWKER